jgi:hypothetical protein
MADPHDQIAELEAEIEQLAGAAERCRNIIMAARLAIGAGGVLLVANLLGLVRLGPLMFIVAIIAVLGGIVIFGSNKSTLGKLMVTISDHEARRAHLIDGLGLHVASGNSRRHQARLGDVQ